jgi:CHASE3 domain sensor protein
MPLFQLREWRSVVLPLAIGFLLLTGVVAAKAWFTAQRGQANAAVQRTLDIELRLSAVLSLLQDAETGQRGYLLTADESYLGPHQAAADGIAEPIEALRALLQGNAAQTQRVSALKKIIEDKLEELKASIELRRADAVQEALTLVRQGSG